MEPCTYFIIAIILFLISLGAATPVAAAATFAVSAIMLVSGVFAKLALR